MPHMYAIFQNPRNFPAQPHLFRCRCFIESRTQSNQNANQQRLLMHLAYVGCTSSWKSWMLWWHICIKTMHALHIYSYLSQQIHCIETTIAAHECHRKIKILRRSRWNIIDQWICMLHAACCNYVYLTMHSGPPTIIRLLTQFLLGILKRSAFWYPWQMLTQNASDKLHSPFANCIGLVN